MNEEQNINEAETPAFLVGAVRRSADGHSVDGDDMHWTVSCPECEKEFEYQGYFDSGDETKCRCGCTFRTRKVWIDDVHYIE